MRFLLSVIADGTEHDGPEVHRAIDDFNERLQANGQLLMAEGMAVPAHSVVLDGRRGEPTRSEGPLHPGSEFRAGFWVIRAADRVEAERLAVEGSRACDRRVELRALLDPPTS